jgi:hypothetical protein
MVARLARGFAGDIALIRGGASRLRSLGSTSSARYRRSRAPAPSPALARFGEVKVVDPTRGFTRVRTIPMSADPGGAAPSAAAPVPVHGTAGKDN